MHLASDIVLLDYESSMSNRLTEVENTVAELQAVINSFSAGICQISSTVYNAEEEYSNASSTQINEEELHIGEPTSDDELEIEGAIALSDLDISESTDGTEGVDKDETLALSELYKEDTKEGDARQSSDEWINSTEEFDLSEFDW